ncbi:MAG TPA: serine--tRNA ligase [Polyangiales bacterium]|nr:serine--tRNA ligase [Polyangiales bacterium]
MLDLRYVVEHLPEARAALMRRGPAAARSLDAIAEQADRRRGLIMRLDALRSEQNDANAAMAAADKKSAEFGARRDALKAVAQSVKALEAELRELEAGLEPLLLAVPNLPSEQTPDGSSEADNRLVREHGQKPALPFAPRDHVELGTKLGILDFERGTKLSGARFVVQRGAGARMSRALMAFMLDLHSERHGYTEVWPPALVNEESMRGTGQLPKFAGDFFRIAPWEVADAPEAERERRDLYLIPTAEVPVTNMHRDEILEAMPVKYCAYTPCFRSEAGSYGKDTRGMIRMHQFDKVELVRFERPEDAEAAHEQLTRDAEVVLQQLGLHYRVMELCAGDLGAGARRCYDIEVWLPAQSTFREISSCSWFGDYQARRAKIRYRPSKTEKPKLVHTINGSGLAIGRTMVAILENYQQADGSVRVPEALVPYMGGLQVIEAGR